MALFYVWKGRYFLGVNEGGPISWNAARTAAESFGAHLASFANLREEAIATAAVRAAGVAEHFWIGLSDAAQEGTFTWVTGQPLRYVNWNAGEPNNNYAGAPENHVAAGFGAAGGWNDMPDLPGPHPANPAGFSPTGYALEWAHANVFLARAGALANGDHLYRGSVYGEWIAAGSGNDIIAAGAGDDRVEAGGGQDRVLGGDGADTLDGGAGADRLFGGAGDDALLGGSGTDRLFGEAGQDLLQGGADNDILDGGAGDDTLIGGGGRDVLIGGEGNDRFVFATIAESSRSAPDRILGFEAGDVIETPAGFHSFEGVLPEGRTAESGVIYSRATPAGTLLFGQLGGDAFAVVLQSTLPSAVASENFAFTFIA